MKGLDTFTIEAVKGLSDDEKELIRQDVEFECEEWINQKIRDFHFRDEEEDFSDEEIKERVEEEFKTLGEMGWRDVEIIDFDKDDDKYEYQFALIVINQFADKL